MLGRTSSEQPENRNDRGSTLVEILISIALIGLVVIAYLSAGHASISATSTVFDAAQVETVLLNAADRVARAPQRCDYEDYVDAAALAEGWSTDGISVSVELLTSNSGVPAADWAPQTCPADVQAFDVQRLTITATDPDGKITRQITVVKSNVE